jgi:hypothetical protein
MSISKNITHNFKEIVSTTDIQKSINGHVDVMKWSNTMKSNHIELLKENTEASHASFKSRHIGNILLQMIALF